MHGLLVVFLSVGFLLLESGNGLCQDSEQEILFQAEQIIFDDKNRVITANGNVILVRGETTVQADVIQYDQNTGQIQASGPITAFHSAIGTFSADSLRLSDDFQNAFIENITLLLTNGGSLSARDAILSEPQALTLTQGIYTACYVDGGRPPLWQIRSARIVRDPETRLLTFHKIVLDMVGVPLLVLPYLSIPDPTLTPTVTRKSGLIGVNGGWKTDLGVFISALTYLDLTPHLDLTANTTVYSQTYPFIDGHLRYRTPSTSVDLKTGVSYDDDQPRGRIQADSLVAITDEWRGGTSLLWVSDPSFLDDYLSPPKIPFLDNRLFVERFTADSYFSVQSLWFESLTSSRDPVILPLLSYSAASSLLSGTTLFDLQVASTFDSEKIHTRLSLQGKWNTVKTSSSGLVLGLGLSLRFDRYFIDSSDAPASLNRLFPQSSLSLRYPLIYRQNSHSHVLEPQLQVLLAPAFSQIDQTFNQESVDVWFNADYLFASNHWIGNDFQETGPRVAYALAYRWYQEADPRLSLIVGQYFTRDQDFPQSSPLNNDFSDYVGKINLSVLPRIQTSYEFHLDGHDLSFSEQTALATITQTFWEFDVSYAKQTYRSSLEQAGFSLTLKPTSTWQTQVSYRHQFRPLSEPYESGAFVAFQNECFRFSTSLNHEYSPTRILNIGVILEFRSAL